MRGWLVLLLAACGDPTADDVEATDVPEVERPVYAGGHEAGPATLRRLTQAEYRRAVRDLVGFEPVLPGALEPDVPIDGLLAVGSASTSISGRGVELCLGGRQVNTQPLGGQRLKVRRQI